MIDQLLKELGNTPEEIANNLEQKGIKGDPCSNRSCPILNYLKQQTNYLYKCEGYKIVDPHPFKDDPVTPVSIKEFMINFDKGLYMRLVK